MGTIMTKPETELRREQARALRDQGLSTREIGNRMGVSHVSVLRLLKPDYAATIDLELLGKLNLDLYRVEDLAIRLGCSPRHVNKLINDGLLRCVSLNPSAAGGKTEMRRITAQDLDAFLGVESHALAATNADGSN
jgi:AraC-like DNA-binding protein